MSHHHHHRWSHQWSGWKKMQVIISISVKKFTLQLSLMKNHTYSVIYSFAAHEEHICLPVYSTALTCIHCTHQWRGGQAELSLLMCYPSQYILGGSSLYWVTTEPNCHLDIIILYITSLLWYALHVYLLTVCLKMWIEWRCHNADVMCIISDKAHRIFGVLQQRM